MARVFVSGSFDMLHSGHITFLQGAARFGDVYVGIGSDESITKYKGKPPVCCEQERAYMLRAIKGVADVSVNPGEGPEDCCNNPILSTIDIWIVNEEQDTENKRDMAFLMKIKYILLPRVPEFGLPARSTSQYREFDKDYGL